MVKLLPGVQVIGWDISKAMLAVADENAQQEGLDGSSRFGLSIPDLLAASSLREAWEERLLAQGLVFILGGLSYMQLCFA